MARNAPTDDGHRIGDVKDRVEVFTPGNEKWTKIDTNTNKFMDQKSDETPFKGVTQK
ncbi:hypothetical protein [Mucilaginibacter sp.]|uniref:hypothetical protein n=1 Tax=Mucilaginibacter sp. TaxID=1882438 RepID=UPI00261BB0E1|nr:hypothetical protein [Mucilaginibacter sp.]MDB5032652.1 hypothetical protein [Mucilaginibacter sp.]